MAGAQTPAPGSQSVGCVGLEAQVEPTSVQEVRTYNIYVCAHTHTVHTHANTHTCAHTRINIHGHAHSTGRLGSTVLTHKHSSLWLSSPPAAQETKHKCVTQNCRGRPYSTSPICEETLGSSGPVSGGAQSMSDPSIAEIVHCRAFKPTPKGLLPYRPQKQPSSAV